MMFHTTRTVAVDIMAQLDFFDDQMVEEDEPECIDLRGPVFGFTLIVEGTPFYLTVKRGRNGHHEP